MEKIAFIADGVLFLKTGEEIREIESPFINDKLSDLEKQKRVNFWKTEDSKMNYQLWSRQPVNESTFFRFRDVLLRDNTLYYFIDFAGMTALLRRDLGKDQEIRLLHKNSFNVHGFDFDPVNGHFVVAVESSDGTVNLELLNREGKHLKMLTSGDSIDTLPRFTEKHSILFSSIGIARNEQGFAIAYSPRALLELDMKDEHIREIMEDQHYDYLSPVSTADSVFAIRKKYRPPGGEDSLWTDVKSILLFPFYLIAAIFNFLNMFIDLFSRKPRNPVGQEQPVQNRKFINVLGETIDLASRQKQGTEISIVPETWELITIDHEHRVRVIKNKVSGFDVAGGDLFVSNGYAIEKVNAEGNHDICLKSRLIQKFSVQIDKQDQ